MMWIVSIVIAYIVGAIPCGAWITLWMIRKDITHLGSGNTGATNVARTLGFKWFFIVFCLDFFKAYAVMYAFCHNDYQSWYCLSIAAALLLGNSYSIFLGGKGGKGIATSLGIIAAYSWYFVVLGLIVWFSVLWMTRNVGISSVVACIVFILICLSFCSCVNCKLVGMCALWSIWRHRKNIEEYVQLLRQ